MKKLLTAFLTTLIVLTVPASTASAASGTDTKIAQLEKQVAILKSEVEKLKALEKQALASCTVDYFKKSREAEKKKATK